MTDQTTAERFRIFLVCSTSTILNEIAAGATQPMVAKTYSLALRSEAAGQDTPDWTRINRAIITRWSMSGLERVKKMAWRELGA